MNIENIVDKANFSKEAKELLDILLEEEGINLNQLATIKPKNKVTYPQLSFAQQRLWFLDQLISNTSSYNINQAYLLSGLLNVTVLKKSIGEIVRRHEVLRTNFSLVDGQPEQVIAAENALTLLVTDLRELPPEQRKTKAKQYAMEESQQPFDLAQDPLFRVKLLHLAEAEYVLLINMHHIISDGWSFNIFFQELAALYTAFSTNKPSPLPELTIQYSDFAVWQREWLQGEVLESQLSYWKQQLCGSLPILQLPTDYPRPSVQTYQGAYQSLHVSLDLTEALKTLSQQEGVTLFMTLLAAFQTLIYRYSGQEDIIIGTPIADRNQVETEKLIGLFINSLAIRTNLSGNPSFEQLLSQVRGVTLGAYDHQDLPLEKLIEELNPERDQSRSPLFQLMFAFQNTPSPPWELPELTITPLEVHSDTAKFDLTLDLKETSEGIKGGIEYNTDLFEAATITRMLGHFQTLLEGIVANPEQHLKELPLLTGAEQHQLLVEWNNTQIDYLNNICIHQLFEFQAKKTPDAFAVIFENQQLSYQELNHCANQLAHYLKSLGVKPETPVGICIERSLDLIVALLGILKAGAAYVPLDSAYPQERLAFMLCDAAVPVLLTQNHLLDKLPSHQGKVVCLDTNWEAISQENPENPKTDLKSSNLAYILYTSGSTGQPKGVGIEHKNTVNFIHWAQTIFNREQLSGVLASTSICFDLSIFELFVPLSCGGQVILAENALHLPTLKAAKDVTLINTVPSAIAELLRVNAILPSVRTVNLAGEPLSPQLINQLYQHQSIQQVYNLYGPTEATTYSTFSLCSTHSNNKRASNSSIGRPIANTQIYILDSHLHLVPIGVPGELYIGGAGLARGYFNRPELTQEKFIANPFSNEPSERLYKTGDLARYLSDGNIEFLGRLDNQVKIRGFRIELGEIEAAIAQHPSVQQTVVTSVEDLTDKSLVAYIVLHSKQTPTTDELRCFLTQKLPQYMIPTAFVLLDTLPLTPNGKIDRCSLPALSQAKQELRGIFVAPQNELELQLTKIWEKNLGIQPISIRDNYFDLGGHSVLAVRLFAEIEKTFSKNLSLATLFQAPTVEQIASLLRQKEWSATLSGVTESSHAWESLVMIQSGSQTKPPLFCIHAVWGNVLFYRKLVRYLDKEQPFYALQAQGVDGKQAPLTSIRKMASHYIREIQTIQPNGPYFLGGFSLGGLLAFEIAQQLHTQGQEVQLLAIFDTGAPSMTQFNSENGETKLQALWERSFLDFRRLLSLGFKDQVAYIWKKLHWHLMRGKVNFFYKFYLHYIKRSLPELRLLEVHKANHQARKSYTAQVYPGRLTLFRSDETFVQFEDDPELGWGQVAIGGVEIYDVPGTIHTTIMEEPGVKVLAEKLQASLDNTQMNK